MVLLWEGDGLELGLMGYASAVVVCGAALFDRQSEGEGRERNDPRVPFHYSLLKGSRATHRIPSKDAQRINSVKIKFRGERKQNNCNFVRIAHLL